MSDHEAKLNFLALIANGATRCRELIGKTPLSMISSEDRDEYAKSAACDIDGLHDDKEVDPTIVRVIRTIVEDRSADDVRNAGEAAWDWHQSHY